ncbi:MAG: transporter substrate-binding domain-containing protein [Clostridia bacterium]|nr:transporter substrate-binding domain-containing protein [Clostridia bacterium]
MKKVISLLLALLMLATCCVAIASCSDPKDEYVAIDATDLLKEDFGIAVKKNSPELLAAVNAVIDAWVADGTMTKYVDYYTALAEYAENGGTAPDANGLQTSWDFGSATEVIKVYTESGFAPFEFLYNNEVVGVDMAIMSQVAVNMGKKIVIDDIAFDTIPTAVETDSGLAVGAAGMTISDDRKDHVDFSSIYYSSTLVIVSVKDKSYDSVADLAGLKVGVQEGTSGDLIISAAITADGYTYENEDEQPVVVKAAGATVSQYKQYALALADLKAGRIDAILMDKLPALTMLATAQ